MRETNAFFHPARAARALSIGLAGMAGLLILASCDRADGAQLGSGQPTASDNVLGDPDAPVTIIEYASTTCPHCKTFHDEVFGELKARYIDPGHVRFVFREMPTPPGPLSVAGMMTARCAGSDKFFDVVDVLFEEQADLVRAYSAGGLAARERLFEIAQDAGLSEDAFERCIRDEAALDRMETIGEAARADWGITTTPAFVVNGALLDLAGPPELSDFAERIDPLLAD